MTECTRCLYTTRHPFGLIIDESGVCSGCRVHEEKTSLDWDARFSRLETIIAERRSRRGQEYDCVVPVRGTPEHFIVLDIIINRLNLRPLVVAYNSQFNSSVGIANVDLMRNTFNVDMIFYASNPIVYRKLVRESLIRLGSVMWPAIAGTTAFPVRIAVEKRIPLVIWPYHQPTEQVGTHSYLDENTMSRRSRHEFDLMGIEPQTIVTHSSLLHKMETADLDYPSDAQLHSSGVRGLYLANFVPWDSRTFSEDAIDRFGAHAARNTRTFDTYDRIDDMTYMTAHDLLKQAKLGYSRVTDNLVREIRFGRIDRPVALELVAHYQRHFPSEELRVFLDWLGMSEDALRWLLRRLPHGDPTDASMPPLSAAAEAFLASFVVNGDAVHDPLEFTIFGKGLELGDRVLRPARPS